MPRKINIVLFGIGSVGSALINKVLKEEEKLAEISKADIRFPVITNSTVAFFEKEGAGFAWEANFIQFAIPFRLEDVVNYVHGLNLENLVAVDATGSAALAAEYADLVKSGFSIVSINESLQHLPEGFAKGIKFLADSRGLSHKFVTVAKGGNKDSVATALLDGILQVAGQQINFAS